MSSEDDKIKFTELQIGKTDYFLKLKIFSKKFRDNLQLKFIKKYTYITLVQPIALLVISSNQQFLYETL